jgi:hypothetical protein
VSYLGVLQQALRDLSAWVEQGVEPPESTRYEVVDGQVVVGADAPGRRGIQPVVRLTANGAARADVTSGEEITLRASAEVPPGTGSIVTLEWDFDGSGTFAVRETIEPAPRVEVERRWSSAEAGTHFPVVRVVAQRAGDVTTPYARLQNLARARVVVS